MCAAIKTTLTLGTIFDPSIQAVQVIPCNNVVGSANIIFGEVIYNYYGYKLLDWPTYLYALTNEHD